MSDVRVTIQGGRTGFLPGERVEVDVEWTVLEDYEKLEALLLWTTDGKGTTDSEVVELVEVERPPRSGRHRFELHLPDFPWSFSGKLITLQWAVEALFEPKGPAGRAELTMSPQREEVALGGE